MWLLRATEYFVHSTNTYLLNILLYTRHYSRKKRESGAYDKQYSCSHLPYILVGVRKKEDKKQLSQ